MIGFLWENEKAEACIPVAGGGKWDMAPKDTGVERRGPGRGKEGFQKTLGEALTSTPSILVQPLHFSLSHIVNFDQMNISQSKTMRPSISCIFCSKWASQVMQVLKNLPANTRDINRYGFDSWVGKSPWRRAWQPTPVILPRESHRQMSLAGYSPWGHKESDTTEATSHTHMPNTLLNPVCKFINFTLKMCL